MFISYKEILKNAWQITLKNKILWAFGFFASFISLEAVYEIILSQAAYLRRKEILCQKVLYLYQYHLDFLNFNVQYFNQLTEDWVAYALFLLIAIIILAFIWLVFISQILIINSVSVVWQNKKLNISDLLSDSINKFWSVLMINVLMKLILYAGFIAISFPLLYALLSGRLTTVNASYFLFFVLYTIFAVVISFLTAYATNFIVLKNLHIIESIKEAWRLFSKNIIISLEIAFILFFLKIVSIIVILSLLFVVFIPIMFIFLLSLADLNVIGVVMSFTLILLAFTLISLLINAIYTTFYLASWTITFLKLNEETLLGKISKLIRNIPSLFQKTARKHNIDLNQKQLKEEAWKLARKTEKEAKILSKKIEAKYIEYQPTIKKQSKVVAQKIKQAYDKLEPMLEKEIKKAISQRKKQKPQTKKTTRAKIRSTKKPSKTRQKTKK